MSDICCVMGMSFMRPSQILTQFRKDYPHIAIPETKRDVDEQSFPTFWKAVQSDRRLGPISNAVLDRFNGLEADIAALPPLNNSSRSQRPSEALPQNEMEPTL